MGVAVDEGIVGQRWRFVQTTSEATHYQTEKTYYYPVTGIAVERERKGRGGLKRGSESYELVQSDLFLL